MPRAGLWERSAHNFAPLKGLLDFGVRHFWQAGTEVGISTEKEHLLIDPGPSVLAAQQEATVKQETKMESEEIQDREDELEPPPSGSNGDIENTCARLTCAESCMRALVPGH